jgi:hypothetical protein
MIAGSWLTLQARRGRDDQVVAQYNDTYKGRFKDRFVDRVNSKRD